MATWAVRFCMRMIVHVKYSYTLSLLHVLSQGEPRQNELRRCSVTYNWKKEQRRCASEEDIQLSAPHPSKLQQPSLGHQL